MAVDGASPSFWHRVREFPARVPLRTKLISALLALVAIALVVISVVGLALLRNDLIGPINTSLKAQVYRAENAVLQYEQGINNQPYAPDIALDWITGSGVTQHVITPVSSGVGNISGGSFGRARVVPGPAIQTNPAWLHANNRKVISLPSTSGAGRWQVYIESGTLPNGSSGTIVLAINATSQYTTIGQLATIDLAVSLAVLALLAVVAIVVIRASLRPLREIEQTAGAIAAGDLTQRVPERDPRTEIGRLGRSLNAMLSQIESAFRARTRSETAARRSEERMRQFVADAGHELKTPLTAIRGFAEYYRQRGGPAAPTDHSVETDVARGNGSGQLSITDLDRIMRRLEQESARMGILVQDMLLLAQLDQQRPLERKTVDLLTLAADAVHDARVVAPGRKINLTVGAGAALLVVGDEVRLRQVIGNLMSNALAHTPDGTAIDVKIRSGGLAEITAAARAAAQRRASELEYGPDPFVDETDEVTEVADVFDAKPGAWPGARVGAPPDADDTNTKAAAVLEVTDYGPGLSAEQAKHAFERFYRADQARTSAGSGLGLAIVAALVAAHGGAVWVSSTPGHGATFSVALPLAPEAVQGARDDDHSFADEMAAELDDDETNTTEFIDDEAATPRDAAPGDSSPDPDEHR